MTAIDRYDALYRGFRWHVPRAFNIDEGVLPAMGALDACAIAIRHETDRGEQRFVSYAELDRDAARLAAALRRMGLGKGDRIALVMPQRVELAASYLATFRIGAIAVPLSMLFGPDALEYRLRDSGARIAIVDESGIDNVRSTRDRCSELQTIIAVGGAEGHGDCDWSQDVAVDADPLAARPVFTAADDPAVLIYTSGTTGPPKGTLIPHRALIGNLPGFVCSQNWFPQEDSVFWSPADWAWTGGLMDALLPTLYFGRPIVAYQGRFAADIALDLLARHRVTHTFLFPTALKAMMKAVPEPRRHHDLSLRAVMSAGEAVGDAVFGWCRDELGTPVNEMFGQTEINYIVGNCAVQWPARAGSMGRPYPGHRIALIDDDGRECPSGTPGDVALHRRDIHGDRDPIFFLGYWKRDDATEAKFTGDLDDSWCRTGDVAFMDDAGYLWYQGRGDDVFKAAGYRIGPSEVENCLVKHATVANAAVVPKPDAERGAVVKAYVVLAPGHSGSTALVAELQAHVRGKLAPYEYPKEIEFIDALPMTTTGKVQRKVLRLQEEERAKAAAVAR